VITSQKQTDKKISIKKLISFMVGVPMAIVAVSEQNDLDYVWVQFVAIGIVYLLLIWNGAFIEREY